MMTQQLTDEDALRDLLDDRNDAGTDDKVAGTDAAGSPFLACLAGPYAEGVVIVFGNPWDPEVNYGTGTHCDECSAQALAGPDRLRYPVTVLLPVGGEQRG